MKIKPRHDKHGMLIGAEVYFDADDDALMLGEVLSYARDLADSDNKNVKKFVNQLAAVAEALNADAQTFIEGDKSYEAMKKKLEAAEKTAQTKTLKGLGLR